MRIELFFVTDTHAHVGRSVFSNYGWIEFEPTAGESLLSRPSGAEEPIDEGNFADTISGNGETNGPDDLPPDITDPSFNDFPEDFGGFDGGAGLAAAPCNCGQFSPILLILGIVGLRFCARLHPTHRRSARQSSMAACNGGWDV
ncbi:MAG: hypothetical protein R2867_05860 [Caldilineaceae bacterium]